MYLTQELKISLSIRTVGQILVLSCVTELGFELWLGTNQKASSCQQSAILGLQVSYNSNLNTRPGELWQSRSQLEFFMCTTEKFDLRQCSLKRNKNACKSSFELKFQKTFKCFWLFFLSTSPVTFMAWNVRLREKNGLIFKFIFKQKHCLVHFMVR